ncbi:MAG TPA: FAD-dependent oxidoreductase [Burkholderiaceae bacterium]|nr:FAD-dependent oxidoreductase [Burkholderiaceae bacterium]
MSPDYQSLVFPYQRPPELDSPAPRPRPVIVVGAGPIGLAAAIELALSGIDVLLLDDDDRLSTGSRAICFSKRTLEILDRLGCGDATTDKGVSWQRGKVFLRNELVYSFDLLPEPGHKRPAFVNLQQYYCEGFLVERAQQLPNLELRWKNRVVELTQHADRVSLQVETPDGRYPIDADWVVAADGARSPIRTMMGLQSHGQVFRDRFLIADVRMSAPFPTERWFWFDPPFHPNQSVLLHKQPDDVWRIDFQLGWDADPLAERDPARVIPRVQALLGKDAQFELVWCSVYTFTCARMERFRHGRVLFAGDAAHLVSPFGARGANSGFQDVENLAWKLARVIRRRAPESLLDSYDAERAYAADENILNSTRSTDFITPKSAISRTFRDATLTLARDAPFARRLVNSGRLSVPAVLRDSPLNTPDVDRFDGGAVPGAPVLDAPVAIDGASGWFVDALERRFTLVTVVDADRPAAAAAAAAELRRIEPELQWLQVRLAGMPESARGAAGDNRCRIVDDVEGLLASRYDLKPGTCYLFRPDQHVTARTRFPDPQRLRAALERAAGLQSSTESPR